MSLLMMLVEEKIMWQGLPSFNFTAKPNRIDLIITQYQTSFYLKLGCITGKTGVQWMLYSVYDHQNVKQNAAYWQKYFVFPNSEQNIY